MELNFRLFNCDRTFSLDKVQALITKVSPEAKVKQQYFGLPQMSELCNELKEEEAFSGYAVFVVHAHESRLSLNEENAGIGYAKLYRTLLKITDDRVLIVIGGDNSYKGNEQEDAFLSQWAWRKICSQFTEDFMDGTKSFIFSWEENHRPIHEEALEFYLNPNKTQQKFVPKLKPPPTKAPSYDPKRAPRDAPKPSGQQPYPKPEEFPPQKNMGRVLPLEPKPLSDVKKDDMKPEPQEIHMDIDKPPISKFALADALPVVHVVSILSGRDDVLQNPVLSLFANAFQSLNIPSGPYVPDVKGALLPQYVEATSPDFVVITSEYDDLEDVINLKQQIRLFQDILTKVKNKENSKVIFVVTGDSHYNEGDLSSTAVKKTVANINSAILKPDKLTVLSWKYFKDTVHQVKITKLLREHKATTRQPKRMPEYITPDIDFVKGHLRYKTIIQDGRVQAVLKSDPYGWSPDRKLLSELFAKHRERTEVQLWENSKGDIEVTVIPATRILRKVVDVGSSKRSHSLQVYSYHSDEEIFQTVRTFIKGLELGIDFTPLKVPIEVTELFHSMEIRKPEYVAFSSDIEVFQDFKSTLDVVKDYWPNVRNTIANLKKIIIILIGDRNCQAGHLVSEEVLRAVRQLDAGIQINQEMITVMSWNTRPFICHQENMKRLLKISHEPNKGTSTYSRDPPGHHGRGEPPKVKDDPTKGYLRFRAELVHGKVGQVSVRIPPNWKPDPRDLEEMFQRNKAKPKATLEFWADTLDGPTKPPVVTTEEIKWYSKYSPSNWLKKDTHEKDGHDEYM